MILELIAFLIIGSFGGFLTQIQGRGNNSRLRLPKKIGDHFEFGFLSGIFNGAGVACAVFLFYMIFDILLFQALLFALLFSAGGSSIVEVAKKMIGIDLIASEKDKEGDKTKKKI